MIRFTSAWFSRLVQFTYKLCSMDIMGLGGAHNRLVIKRVLDNSWLDVFFWIRCSAIMTFLIEEPDYQLTLSATNQIT